MNSIELNEMLDHVEKIKEETILMLSENRTDEVIQVVNLIVQATKLNKKRVHKWIDKQERIK